MLRKNIFAEYSCKIPIRISIYSAEMPPRRLEINLNGEDLVQGKTIAIMSYDVKEG